jgi:hypothetical protein
LSFRKVPPAWKVVIEQRFYTPEAMNDAGHAESEFGSERDAKAFARRLFANGSVIRAERLDDGHTVKPTQIAAWIIGTPHEQWPE